MKWSNVAMSAAAVALLLSAPLQARAMEIVGGSGAAGAVNDGLIQTVAHARAGGGVHRGAHVNRNVKVNRNVNVNRNTHVNRNVNVNRNVHVSPGYRPGVRPPVAMGGWVRPGWYRWPAGGAIAAGAAIGFATAAAVTWATPPQPGLCWYYTDASQRNGFWDACP